MTRVATMARKKSKSREEDEPRRNIIAIRGTEEWRAWLKEYAAFRRVPVNVLIDIVLAENAKRDGFRSPPER